MNGYIVYKHTCPDNKVYIGITCQEPSKRWLNGLGYKKSWFYNAIQKYSWENIKHEILYENLSYEDAINKEHKLILEYESWCPAKGYNDSIGVGHHKTYPIKVVDLNMVFIDAKRCAEYLNVPLYGVKRLGNRYGHIFEYACEENCSFSDICIV